MDINLLRSLIKEESEITLKTADRWDGIYKAKCELLKEDLAETIAFFSSCTEEEFVWCSNAFSEISEKFRSQEFIDCLLACRRRFPHLRDVDDEIRYAKRFV
jgi:hypothetical protein